MMGTPALLEAWAQWQACGCTGRLTVRACMTARPAHGICSRPPNWPPSLPCCPLPLDSREQVAEDLYSDIFGEDFDRIVPVSLSPSWVYAICWVGVCERGCGGLLRIAVGGWWDTWAAG